MATVYFHDKMGAKKGTPPSVSALAGAATENGTWFVDGGHLGIWADDNICYTGGIGTGLVKFVDTKNKFNSGFFGGTYKNIGRKNFFFQPIDIIAIKPSN